VMNLPGIANVNSSKVACLFSAVSCPTDLIGDFNWQSTQSGFRKRVLTKHAHADCRYPETIKSAPRRQQAIIVKQLRRCRPING
jgi:hypothetical protein